MLWQLVFGCGSCVGNFCAMERFGWGPKAKAAVLPRSRRARNERGERGVRGREERESEENRRASSARLLVLESVSVLTGISERA